MNETSATIQNLGEFLRSDAFMAWNSENFSTIMMEDDDRFNRMIDACEYGGEGSTHGEIIDDWVEALDVLRYDLDLDDEVVDDLMAEIEECREWHRKNGSLDEVVG